MTTVALDPNGSSGSLGVSPTGAATLEAALSDSSDSSYCDVANSSYLGLQFDDLPLPSGAVITTIGAWARVAKVSNTTQIGFNLDITRSGDQSILFVAVKDVTWATPTDILVGSSSMAVTDAEADTLGAAAAATSYDVRVYKLWTNVTYLTKPVPDVTAPTGSITTTNRPTVTWTNTLDYATATGDYPQTAYEVKIFTDAQYLAGGFDPSTSASTVETGVLTGAGLSWQPDSPLPDDTYRAYVRVAQTVRATNDLWSDWDYSGFTLAVSPPAVPTITVTADNTNARNKIELHDQTGAATTDSLELQRSTDGGTTWAPVRLDTDTAGVIAATDATVYDYEGGNGETVSYRARALHDYSGVYAASAWTATKTSAWTSTEWWLKNPRVPSLNAAITVRSQAEYKRPARRGIFQPLGANNAIAITDTRGADTGQIVIKCDTDADAAALDALLDSGDILLVQAPADHHFTDRYVTVGDLSRARIVNMASMEATFNTVDWTETDKPSGALTAP